MLFWENKSGIDPRARLGLKEQATLVLRGDKPYGSKPLYFVLTQPSCTLRKFARRSLLAEINLLEADVREILHLDT